MNRPLLAAVLATGGDARRGRLLDRCPADRYRNEHPVDIDNLDVQRRPRRDTVGLSVGIDDNERPGNHHLVPRQLAPNTAAPPPPSTPPPPDNTAALCDTLIQTSIDISDDFGATVVDSAGKDLPERQAAARQFAGDVNAIRPVVSQAASTATNPQVMSAANEYASALDSLAAVATEAGDTGDLDSIAIEFLGPVWSAFDTIETACPA